VEETLWVLLASEFLHLFVIAYLGFSLHQGEYWDIYESSVKIRIHFN